MNQSYTVEDVGELDSNVGRVMVSIAYTINSNRVTKKEQCAQVEVEYDNSAVKHVAVLGGFGTISVHEIAVALGEEKIFEAWGDLFATTPPYTGRTEKVSFKEKSVWIEWRVEVNDAEDGN